MLDRETSNEIIGDSILWGESIASQYRSALVRETIAQRKKIGSLGKLIRRLLKVTAVLSPILASAFWRADMIAWLSAYEYRVNRMPDWLRGRLAESTYEPPGGGTIPIVFDGEEHFPGIRFPRIEKAAQSLIERQVLRRDQFDTLSRQAKAEAFTIAGDLSERTISKVRDSLADVALEGPSLDTFRAKVTESIGKSPIGSGHLENVYRTNIQAAYRDGNESLMQNPIVSAVFPYQEYIPIHDTRVRDEHEQLGSLGLNGTGIYRRDDPFWNFFTPPWGYQCRCGTNALTIEAAARKGVLEAQHWLESGTPPAKPEHRLSEIPFEPPEGFGQRGGKLVIP